MDCFQGVVAGYVGADRSVFVKPECCVQLDPGNTPVAGMTAEERLQ